MSEALFVLVFFLCSMHDIVCWNDHNQSGYGFSASNYKKMNSFNSSDSLSSCSSSNPVEVCPVGFFCNGTTCKCSQYPYDIIKCDENEGTSAILDCYCAAFDKRRNVTEVGACVFNCAYWNMKSGSSIDRVYNPLPGKAMENNGTLCELFNRAGALCGRCLPEHYPLVYSYNFTCIKCPHVNWNWGRYIMAAYLPLTLFCFFVIFFKINTVTSHLHPVIWFSQALSMPALSRILLLGVRTHPSYLWILKTVLSLYGLWNLDFFRPFYSDICLGIGLLPTLALDYIIAVYPLLLMAITYLLVNLYDKNYRVIIIIWKPFHTFFSFFKRNWNIRSSLIDSFATFFLLSNVKFLSVTFDLLAPIKRYELHQDGVYNTTFVLYYSADTEYFCRKHLPYAILAILVSIVFIILPITILALYPFTFFQKFLNCLPIRHHILHTFMDSFTGCYKDGTEPNTRDCRWFAALFFLVRFLSFVLYALTLSSAFLAFMAIILSILVAIIIDVQPFKPPLAHYSKINATFFTFLVMSLVTMIGFNTAVVKIRNFVTFFNALIIITGILPLLYTLILILKWIVLHRKFGLRFVGKFRSRSGGYSLMNTL